MSGPPPPPRRRKPNPVAVLDNKNNINNNNVKSPTKSTSPIKTFNKDESIEKLQIDVDTEYSNQQIEIPASTIAYNEFNSLLSMLLLSL